MSIILKEIRKIHNLTQTALAKKLEVSRSAIAQIESGKNNISLDLAKKISVTFSLPITKILNSDKDIAWDIIGQSENSQDIYKSFYGEIGLITLKLDEIEYLKMLVSKIAKEKKLKILTERFDKFCKEYDFYDSKKEFSEAEMKNYDENKIKKMFKLVDLGLTTIKDDLCSMLIFEYDILKDYYEPQYRNK